jgi:phage terminase small subunit
MLYLLEAACGAWDRLEGARQTLAREGITVAGRYGPRAHPAVGVERDARFAFARLLTQLDLDPPPERYMGGSPAQSLENAGTGTAIG